MSQPTRNLSILSRLFGRSNNSAVAKVHAHAFGHPLLVHPSIGEQLVGAYVSGAIDTPPAIRMASGDAAAVAGDAPAGIDPDKVAILNISGALVNRPMPDACGDGPTSYVAIRRAFDAALTDSNVEAIVLRLNSPGGMASGCFDLTDHIYANRKSSGGPKRVIGLVDDMAYSGCFAIAAACDEIWVSRTGGTGSVGVVFYHCDQSGADAKAGVKITPIFSGARKIDFNPHFPLSPEAQQSAQAESDALYDLFVSSVATYRGMDPDAVRATQAGTFTGAAAIAAGLADRQGTLYDVMADLANPAPEPEAIPVSDPAEETPPVESEPEPEAVLDPDDGPTSDEADPNKALPEDAETAEEELAAARTMRMGVLSAALATSKLAGDVVTAVLSHAKEMAVIDTRAPDKVIEEAARIVDFCVAAGVKDLAGEYIKQGLSAEQARKSIAALKADVGPELVTAPPAGNSGVSHQPPSPWATTISRFGGKKQ